MENALGFVVQDAVEIFVARAMRLRVFDDHMMVGELFIFREVKPIENAFQTFAREIGADVVARNLCAQGDGVDTDIARAAKLARDGRDVICVGRFVLQFDMFDICIVARKYFRHRIREVSDIARA